MDTSDLGWNLVTTSLLFCPPAGRRDILLYFFILYISWYLIWLLQCDTDIASPVTSRRLLNKTTWQSELCFLLCLKKRNTNTTSSVWSHNMYIEITVMYYYYILLCSSSTRSTIIWDYFSRLYPSRNLTNKFSRWNKDCCLQVKS